MKRRSFPRENHRYTEIWAQKAGGGVVSTDPLNCMHGPQVPGGIRWIRGLLMRAAVVVEVVLRPNTECLLDAG